MSVKLKAAALAAVAALALSGCADDKIDYSYQPPPVPRRQMDPNAAAMIWMMYSNQMADQVESYRQQPAPTSYCHTSGGTTWCR